MVVPVRHLTALLLVLAASGCHQIGQRAKSPARSQAAASGIEGVPATQELTPGQSADACVATAEELEHGGWEREAIAVYERALTFEPNRPGIRHRLARLHARSGNANAARELFQSAVAEDENDSAVLNDFGYFLLEQGDHQLAEVTLRKALQLKPDDQRCQTNLALTLAATGQFDESFALFNSAVGPAAAHANLAVLYARSGQMAESQAMLAKARALDPTIQQVAAVQDWIDGNRPGVSSGSAIQQAHFEQEIQPAHAVTPAGGRATLD